MYKILIKKPQLPKNSFTFYTETISTVNEETDEVTKTTVIYETDDLTTLAEKYQELLATYTTEEMKLIEDLEVEMVVSVNDN